jgi:UDP-GlcNAc:undecaprenyl-phosphate/decaprenyl-phosphate GlcNAc-1-phosphate transferase
MARDGLMSSPEWVAPLCAFLVSVLLTRLACKVAPWCGFVDRPDGGRKDHRKPTPVLGGAAFFSAMLLTVLGAVLLQRPWILDPNTLSLATALGGSATLFCLLGVIDDRLALRPRTKLLGQVVASLPFAVLSTASVESVQLLGWQLSLDWFAVPFTVLWLVACSNVINLMDGLDGLAGTVGTISMLTVAALFAGQGEPNAATLALIAAASIGGFLVFNWPPANIFMGDGGSLTVGFLVGALSIAASSKTATSFTLAVPLVLISVPIFDTFMAIMRRKLNGRGIGEGDRGHIHHRLQDHGLSRKQALLAIGGLSLVMAVAAFVTAKLDNEVAGLCICGCVLATLIAGRVFGYHETVLFFRHIQELGVLLLDSSGVLQTRFLLARMDHWDPRQRLSIWQHVVQRVEQMGAVRLEFRRESQLGHEAYDLLEWRSEHLERNAQPCSWTFAYSAPLPDGDTVTLEAIGRSTIKPTAQRLDDLFRLFARVCQELPELSGIETNAEATTLPLRPAAPLPQQQRKAA